MATAVDRVDDRVASDGEAMLILLGITIYITLGLLTLWAVSKRHQMIASDDEYPLIIITWPFFALFGIMTGVFAFLTWLGKKVVK